MKGAKDTTFDSTSFNQVGLLDIELYEKLICMIIRTSHANELSCSKKHSNKQEMVASATHTKLSYQLFDNKLTLICSPYLGNTHTFSCSWC